MCPNIVDSKNMSVENFTIDITYFGYTNLAGLIKKFITGLMKHLNNIFLNQLDKKYSTKLKVKSI